MGDLSGGGDFSLLRPRSEDESVISSPMLCASQTSLPFACRSFINPTLINGAGMPFASSTGLRADDGVVVKLICFREVGSLFDLDVLGGGGIDQRGDGRI